MNIFETWFKSFAALPAPEKVGWVFICIAMMLISPEINFIFCKMISGIKFIAGGLMK